MLGGCGAVAALVVRQRLPWLEGTPRALALAVWFVAAVLAVHLVPGAVGLFVPEAVVAATGVLLAATVWHTRRGTETGLRRALPDSDRSRRGMAVAVDADRRLGWALAAGAVLAVAGCAIALLRDIAGTPILAIDALNFQVPVAVRWLQQDSIWGLHQFIADYSNATYPHHGNVLVAAVMAPFDSAFLARLVPVPFWGLTGVAVYAIARELGAPRAASVLAGAALLAMPLSTIAGLEGVQTDFPMLAMLGAGVLFLLRARGRAELVTAGLALGIAFGTKWYAVTAVAAIVALWALMRPGLRPLATVVAAGALPGAFWLARNWAETGNPLFPQALPPLFDAPPDPLREAGGFTLAHYLFDFDVWREYLRPAFASTFGWAGAVFAAGALAAGVLSLVRRDPAARPGPLRAIAVRTRVTRPVAVVFAATVVLFGLYLITPYSAFGPEGRPVLAQASTRYGLPAVLGAAVLTAWLAGRVRHGVVEVLLALVVADGLRRGYELPLPKVALGLAVAAALGAAVRWWPAGRPGVAVAAAALALGGVAVAVVADRRADTQGYGQFDPVLAALPEGGARIGLAGEWSPDQVAPPLPAFGPRFGNEVAYVGEFVDGMLRPFKDAARFERRACGFDLVVVGRFGDSPAEGWAIAAGFEVAGASERLLLVRPQCGSPSP